MRDLLISAFRASYRWGRDNCEGRSEKNANDFLETSIAKKCLDKVDVLQSQNAKMLQALKDILLTNPDHVLVREIIESVES